MELILIILIGLLLFDLAAWRWGSIVLMTSTALSGSGENAGTPLGTTTNEHASRSISS
jgi:hypothetical protein